MFLNKDVQDHNVYFIRCVHNYNVMIAFLLIDVDNTITTTSIVINMIKTFKEMKFELMMNIEDDISNFNKDYDIRLRNVIVSLSTNTTNEMI